MELTDIYLNGIAYTAINPILAEVLDDADVPSIIVIDSNQLEHGTQIQF